MIPTASKRPVTAFRVRPTVALGALALVGLGWVLHRLGDAERVNEPSDLDVFIHAWVVRNRPELPWLTAFFHAATLFGNPNPATFFTALVTFSLYGLSRFGFAGVRRGEALVWLLAILGGRFLSIGAKLYYQRERPPEVHRLVTETTYSFPSGHSVFAAVFFTLLAVTLARVIPRDRRAWRAAAVVACLTLAVLVGASRIWLGVHYPTDVLGGLLLGFGWVAAVETARRGWGGRRSSPDSHERVGALPTDDG